jgi:hypothetical protein
MNTVVISRRKHLPPPIQKCLETAGRMTKYFVDDPKCSTRSVAQMLSSENPKFVLIDGEYGPKDREILAGLNLMDQTALRLRLLDPKSELPQSMQILKLVHALKPDSLNIVIFIDDPSDALKQELTRMGASFIWPTLNRLSKLESSFHHFVGNAKVAASGLTGMAKSIYDHFRSPSIP